MSSLLVLGGARSGKSRYAQTRAESLGLKQIYVATAQAFDREMNDRISRHRADRDARWETIEAPIEVARALRERSARDTVMLVDCLTLWTTNLILGDYGVAEATQALVEAVADARGPIILVANEVGYGIVPENALARRFRDEAGVINQQVAAAVGEVQLVVAAIPISIK